MPTVLSHRRVTRAHLALALVLAAASLTALPPLLGIGAADAVPAAGPAAVRAAVPADVPDGRWETFASGNDVLSLALDEDTLWAGTRGGGLVRWDLGAAEYVQYLRPQDPLASNTIREVAVGADGVLWLATDDGLTMFDPGATEATGDDVWRSYTVENTHAGLPSNDVHAVEVDDGLVWVGTAQVWDPLDEAWVGGGLARLDTGNTPETADDTWAPVVTFEGTIRESPDGIVTLGLVSDNINDLVLTGDGNLFVATSPHWRYEKPPVAEIPPRWTLVHGGISHLDTAGDARHADDSWTATDCEKMQDTVTCNVQAMEIDPGGTVWAAIQGRGVMYFPSTEKRIIDETSRRFDLPEGAPGDFVDAIGFGSPDDPHFANTVWFARRKGGVSVLDHNGTLRRRTDDIWNFDRGGPITMADGLARDRTQAVAVGEGSAWIGTGPSFGVAGGVSPIDLEDIKVGIPLTTDNAPVTNFITRLAFGEDGSQWADTVWLATGSRVQQRFGAGAIAFDTHGTLDRADDTWTQYTMLGTDSDGQAPWTGLAGDNVQAVATQGDLVWIGSTESLWDNDARRFTDGGLSVFDGESWSSRTVDNTGGPESGLRHGSVSSLGVGCEGELWIGTGDGWSFWGSGVEVLTPGISVHVLGQDQWSGHDWPALASNNTTDVHVDCDRDRVWVAAEHHVTRGNPAARETGGLQIGGGVSVYDTARQEWTTYTGENGLECYDANFIDCEATSVNVSRDGDVWVGTYGTRDMSPSALVSQHPYYPAVVNVLPDGAPDWLHEKLMGAGHVSALEVDSDGRLWVGTTRGGAARDVSRPERWRIDRVRGGIAVHDSGRWVTLNTATSGIPSNDISDVAVAPNGDIWIATEGWGMARFQPHGNAPTPTPTSDAPTPTASPTRTSTPTRSPTEVEPTPTGPATGGTPSGSVTPTATRWGPGDKDLCLPMLVQKRKR